MLHNYALPKCYNFALVTPNALHAHIPSPPTVTISSTSFPKSLCGCFLCQKYLSPLQVNCDSTFNNNSNVNSEINSFLGISSPYPGAELSSSLLCTPVFAYTWHWHTAWWQKTWSISSAICFIPSCTCSSPLLASELFAYAHSQCRARNIVYLNWIFSI